MRQVVMAFYILFFATGFMGSAALLLLQKRVRSQLLRLLVIFQALFVVGMGVVMALYAIEGQDTRILLLLATLINTALWCVVLFIIRRMTIPSKRPRQFPPAAQILTGLVILKSAANVVLVAVSETGFDGLAALTGTGAWNLGGHVLTGLAMASFGVHIRGPLNPGEPPALRPLLRAYGLCAIIFAPMGLIESVLQSSGISWMTFISLDHLFYMVWNLVSMSAILRLFQPGETGTQFLDEVPQERIKALGLSPREAEMAVMIGRGLSNKEIAEQLFISPATVRTHIYNLYRKVGAGSRVELLNMLRS
jgi:DNA-binding CsgD family transcriptional regulator